MGALLFWPFNEGSGPLNFLRLACIITPTLYKGGESPSLVEAAITEERWLVEGAESA